MTSDLQRYLGLFVSESTDKLQKLGAGLVRLESAGRAGEPLAPLVDEMFRHAHSLKGMAAAMEQDGIKDVAHRAESLLAVFRRSGQAPGPASVDALLAAVDAMQALVGAASRGERQPADQAVLERLGAVPAPVPAAPPAALHPEVEPVTLPAAASRRIAAEVEISPGCQAPAVRAYLVLRKLGALGRLVASSPGADDLKAGRLPERRVTVVVDSAEGMGAVERALAQISDLASVQLREEAVPSPAAPAAPGPAARDEGARTVRVRVDLLDTFLDAVGELILATARIREVGKAIPESARQPLDEGVDRLHSVVKDLHDKVMAVRMTPLASITDRLPRAVRDLARKVGKQVELEVHGAEIEIDRAILDELSDPLLHVVRNAVDHGIEPSHLRQLAGKPPTGKVVLSARRERDRVIVDVSDDGKGMDPARLRAAAVERGALGAEEAGRLSDPEALLLSCLPGVSTAAEVTEVSGRGVGMDAVKRVVEAVGGTLELASAPGRGTSVSLRLPLTVAVQPVLLVRVGEEVLGLPIAKVHGAAQVDVAALERSRGEPMLPYGGGLVPVRDLSALLGLPPGDPGRTRQVVVTDGDGARVGLAVDGLLGQEEAVLKPLARPLDRVAGLSAVTVLGSGRPVFILDVPRLGP